MDKIARIRQEIDKRYQEYRAKMKTEDFTYYEGMADALDLFEQFVDTLSEEHDKSLEVDLEKIIEQTYHDGSVADTDDMDHATYENIARHFFELGLNARKEE